MQKTANVLLFLAVLFLSACAGSRTVTYENDNSLRQINKFLEDKAATIKLNRGEELANAQSVHVGLDSTHYRERRGQKQKLATSKIGQVIISRESKGARTGFFVGATPGVLMIGLGALASAGETSEGWGEFVGQLYIAWGLITTMVGVTVGTTVGEAVDPSKQVVVYEEPIDRYVR